MTTIEGNFDSKYIFLVFGLISNLTYTLIRNFIIMATFEERKYDSEDVISVNLNGNENESILIVLISR